MNSNLIPYDGQLILLRQFYGHRKTDDMFHFLMKNIDWQTETIFIFGRWVPVPRLMSWYGDADAFYTYSGVRHRPQPWFPELKAIKEDVEAVCHASFNSVLANLYRNGHDSMGCHADNEKELGNNPTIASLSLGESRLFRLQHNRTKQKIDIVLETGDLLIMSGTIQHHWKHALPKTRQTKTERINLTFRKVFSEGR
jgi:alkylated DNA repair dioxygenase AlkB